MAKECRQCGASGPFQADRSRPDGLKSRCKICCNAGTRAYKARIRQAAPARGRYGGVGDHAELQRRLRLAAGLKAWACGADIRLDVLDAVLGS